jgi:hypothetical protein
MTNKNEENYTKLEEIKDMLEQAICASRECVPDSFSQVLYEIKTDLKKINTKLDDHIAKSNPVLKAMEAVSGAQGVLMWITTKLIVPLAILLSCAYAIKEWIKK